MRKGSEGGGKGGCISVWGLLEDYQGALGGRTIDPVACAERKQRREDAPRQIISSHSLQLSNSWLINRVCGVFCLSFFLSIYKTVNFTLKSWPQPDWLGAPTGGLYGGLCFLCVRIGEWMSAEIQNESVRERNSQGDRGHSLPYKPCQPCLFTNYHQDQWQCSYFSKTKLVCVCFAVPKCVCKFETVCSCNGLCVCETELVQV